MASFLGDEVVVFYVDGESGDDAHNDTQASTKGTAWKTIDHAFSRIASHDAGTPGDGTEVRICATSNDATYYSEAVTHELDWHSKEVHIVGANGDGVVDGTRPTIYGTDLGSGENSIWEFDVQTADHTHISNLIFDGADASNCHHCIHFSTNNNHNVKFLNCRFRQAADHGVDFDGQANYTMFINCQFDNNGGKGMYENSTQFGLVYKCLFNDNASDGGFFSAHARIVQSVFYNNGNDGCRVSTSGAVICGCVFEDNTSDGLYITGTGMCHISDSVSTGNGAYGWNVASGSEAIFFECHSHGNSSGQKNTGAVDRIIMHPNRSSSDPGWESEATYDFTPAGSSHVVGGGLSTPFLYMGSTSADAGINKFRTSPYQLRASTPRRH